MKGYPNKINEKFFFEWSPELAYILGILATDGCLIDKMGKKKVSCIQLELTDKEIIENIANVIGYEGKIYHRVSKNKKHKDRWRISFGNKNVFEKLISLNITPRKTKTLKISPIPDEFFYDYFRGIFDGDGTITKSSNSRELKIVSASKIFIQSLQEKIKLLSNIKANIYTANYWGKNSQYHLCISAYSDLRTIYNSMYININNHELYLKRKKEKLHNIILEWNSNIRGYSIWEARNLHSKEELEYLHFEQKIPLKTIAIMWGIKYISIRNLIKELGIKCKRYGAGSKQYWNFST